MARRLLLVRHARPAGVEPGVLLGSTDVAIGARGLAEARAAATQLRRRQADACVSSPLARCRQTAEILAGPLSVAIDEGLREVDFGRWECRTPADVAAAEPELVERWSRFEPEFAFPGGEGLAAFVERVRQCAARLARHPAQTLLVVTHGGMIRMLLCHYLGLQPRQYVLFAPGYLSVAAVDLFDGRGVLAFDDGPATGDQATQLQEAGSHD